MAQVIDLERMCQDVNNSKVYYKNKNEKKKASWSAKRQFIFSSPPFHLK